MGQPTLGHTEVSRTEFIGPWKATWGSEPSQYLEEEKSKEIPSVAASERGRAQTEVASAIAGLWGSATWSYKPAV